MALSVAMTEHYLASSCSGLLFVQQSELLLSLMMAAAAVGPFAVRLWCYLIVLLVLSVLAVSDVLACAVWWHQTTISSGI